MGLPSQCDADSQVCDMGTDMHGCWMGDWCQSLDYPCPPVCPNPMPSQCDENSKPCDMGWNGGCWNGDYCPNGGGMSCSMLHSRICCALLRCQQHYLWHGN